MASVPRQASFMHVRYIVLSLGQEDPLEEGMTTHFSILAWRIPWTEEPGGLLSMGSHPPPEVRREGREPLPDHAVSRLICVYSAPRSAHIAGFSHTVGRFFIV